MIGVTVVHVVPRRERRVPRRSESPRRKTEEIRAHAQDLMRMHVLWSLRYYKNDESDVKHRVKAAWLKGLS